MPSRMLPASAPTDCHATGADGYSDTFVGYCTLGSTYSDAPNDLLNGTQEFSPQDDGVANRRRIYSNAVREAACRWFSNTRGSVSLGLAPEPERANADATETTTGTDAN